MEHRLKNVLAIAGSLAPALPFINRTLTVDGSFSR